MLTAGLGGMGGAQPLAVTMNGGVAPLRRGRSRRASSGGIETRYLDAMTDDRSTRRSRWVGAQRGRAREPLSIGLIGNAAEVLPELVRARHACRTS